MPRRLRATSLLLVVVAFAIATLAQPALADASVGYDLILSGYSRPIHVTSAHDPDVLYIVQQGGTIERARFKAGSWEKLSRPLLDITDRVNEPTGFIEQGILGATFHPQFQRNGLFYVAYTRKAAGDRDGDSVVSEFRRGRDGTADPGSERILLVVPQSKTIHAVANLVFGPDGYLYIGSGDGGFGRKARDLTTKLGKILRIDPRDPDGNGPKRFTVPPDNPYVGKPGLDIIWASGFRNPWRFSFDRFTGDLWIGDVGESLREEVDRARPRNGQLAGGRGKDFGWNVCEASLERRGSEGDPDDRCGRGVLPAFEYDHGEHKCAIIGGHVYRGPAAAWRGLYIAVDSCGWQFVLERDGGARIERRTLDGGIVSYGDDAIGNLYAAYRGQGEAFRVTFTEAAP
jgi:glucose/arabinose dehydrogenase